MAVLILFVLGLVIWIVGWSITGNGFDFFMVTIALLVLGATIHLAAPFVKKLLGHEPEHL